ncbi:MAG: PAS domain-containing protein [Cyclobacteriaceae bacterium]|nr:PAS domain-containing protein [Cyclobacteriaceae bacterium]
MPRIKPLPHFLVSRLKPNTLAVITFVLLLFLTCYFSIKQYRIIVDRESFEAYTMVNEAKNRMQKIISNSISATELLSFFVQEYGDDAVDNFDVVAKEIMFIQKHIDALQLSPHGKICCVYPLEGNESVIGYNILADPKGNREAFEAIERRQLFFAGPLSLKQGGTAVLGRLPIFKNNTFWGFSAVLIKLSTMLKAADIDTIVHNGFQFQLSKVNPNTGKEEFFLKENSEVRPIYASQVVIPSGELKLSVFQIDKNKAIRQTIPIFIMGLLLSVTGAGFIRMIIKDSVFLGQRLNQSEKDYISVFEGVEEGIFRTTMEGRILLANPSFAKIFGYNSIVEMKRKVVDVGDKLYYSREDRERLLGELLVKGFVNKMEVQSLTKGRDKIWISISAHLSYETGNIISYIEGTVTDITARKKDRDKLDEQFKVLREYAFINSHEVRAYVARLLGLVNLFNEQYIAEAEKERVIRLIADETAKLDIVIRGLSSRISEVEEY